MLLSSTHGIKSLPRIYARVNDMKEENFRTVNFSLYILLLEKINCISTLIHIISMFVAAYLHQTTSSRWKKSFLRESNNTSSRCVLFEVNWDKVLSFFSKIYNYRVQKCISLSKNYFNMNYDWQLHFSNI